MRRIAPEVERLMWLIAEERDPRAIADFESRFPELKMELSKHMAMVSGLKTAGRKVPEHRIPRFVPRYGRVQRKQTGLYVAIAFVAGALAFGSYAGITLMRSEPVQTPVARTVPSEEQRPLLDPSALVKKVPPAEVAPSVAPAASPNTVSDFEDPLLKPVTFDVDAAPLKVAIAMICKAAGIQADIPLDLPQEEANLHCDNLAAGEVLNELGRAHGFTVFPQELGKVLLLPGRPTTEASNEPSKEGHPVMENSERPGHTRTSTGREYRGP